MGAGAQKGKHTFGGASGKQIMQIRETTMTKTYILKIV